MGLLETLKTLLGRDDSDREDGHRRRDRAGQQAGTTVTVEHEPAPENEAAVKGADLGEETAAGEPEAEPEPDTAVEPDAAPEADESETPAETEPAGASPPVEEISGIGPTYAGRLEAAGIETVADLADADAETVAEAAETAPSRASDWIEQAEED
jgi:predicted flap endonuclease-1-like 5' DNA nuclease